MFILAYPKRSKSHGKYLSVIALSLASMLVESGLYAQTTVKATIHVGGKVVDEEKGRPLQGVPLYLSYDLYPPQSADFEHCHLTPDGFKSRRSGGFNIICNNTRILRSNLHKDRVFNGNLYVVFCGDARKFICRPSTINLRNMPLEIDVVKEDRLIQLFPLEALVAMKIPGKGEILSEKAAEYGLKAVIETGHIFRGLDEFERRKDEISSRTRDMLLLISRHLPDNVRKNRSRVVELLGKAREGVKTNGFVPIKDSDLSDLIGSTGDDRIIALRAGEPLNLDRTEAQLVFEADSAWRTSQIELNLDKFAKKIRSTREQFVISGRAHDFEKSESDNIWLSYCRAKKVYEYLIRKPGINSARFRFDGFGSSCQQTFDFSSREAQTATRSVFITKATSPTVCVRPSSVPRLNSGRFEAFCDKRSKKLVRKRR